jgi:uncharacterized protein (TIGR02246 family)
MIPMRTKWLVLAGGLLAALVFLNTREQSPLQGSPAAKKKKVTPVDNGERAADREAIVKGSRAFAAAFAKGDAKAVASFWTEHGEFHDDNGTALRGRADIEKSFTEILKEKAGGKIEVHIDSLRFLSRDAAIEEGILRYVPAGKELPSTSLYSVMHVREDGQWKIAHAREWGSGQDRLEDIEWLIGTWKGGNAEREVYLSLKHDKQRPFVVGEFTTKAKGKVTASGSMKIGLDPQRGQLRSWHFEDDGGHGQALWIRDGDRWVLDAIGAQGDGTETAALNILGRINDDAFTWRSIDRQLGEEKLPDTAPIRLSRVKDK